MAFEREQIAGRRLARDNPADVEREVGEARETRALGVEMPELEPPAVPLTAGVLTRDAVEPAFDTARQREVGRVDCQHQTPVEDALVEPLGQDELHALAAANAGGELLPFVDPGELLASPMLAVTDGGADDGRLQAGERAFEQVILAVAGRPADGDQELVRREAEEA